MKRWRAKETSSSDTQYFMCKRPTMGNYLSRYGVWYTTSQVPRTASPVTIHTAFASVSRMHIYLYEYQCASPHNTDIDLFGE